MPVLSAAAPKVQPFLQAVGGEPVGAVQSAGGDFAGGPQAGTVVCDHRGRSSVRRSCSARRPDGDPVVGQIEPEFTADLADVSEIARHACHRDVPQVDGYTQGLAVLAICSVIARLTTSRGASSPRGS